MTVAALGAAVLVLVLGRRPSRTAGGSACPGLFPSVAPSVLPKLLATPKVAPRPTKRKVDEMEQADLRAEAHAAKDMSIPWQQRGPGAPIDNSQQWRGQKWREGSQRWANSGGSNGGAKTAADT